MSEFDPENSISKDLKSRVAKKQADESLPTASSIGGAQYSASSDVLSAMFRANGYGGFGNKMFSLLKGVNHRGSGDVVSPNLEHAGYVFFTRPELNLTTDNIMAVRRLRYLLNDNPNGLPNYIRSTLMPHTITSTVPGLEGSLARSPYVEERSPFIPLKTNTLKSISGWPDEIINISDYQEGMRKQVTGYADDIPNNYSQFDLTCSFINVRSSPIYAMLSAMRQYITTASIGGLSPFPKVRAARYLDYTQRIYVLITDENRIKIRLMACTGAAIMKGLPTGAEFNYSNESPVNTENETIDVPYHCYGVRYNDPIIVQNFNQIVKDYNPDFYKALENNRRGEYIRIPHNETEFVNFEAIPFINADTMELEWYCRESRYNEIMASVKPYIKKTE